MGGGTGWERARQEDRRCPRRAPRRAGEAEGRGLTHAPHAPMGSPLIWVTGGHPELTVGAHIAIQSSFLRSAAGRSTRSRSIRSRQVPVDPDPDSRPGPTDLRSDLWRADEAIWAGPGGRGPSRFHSISMVVRFTERTGDNPSPPPPLRPTPAPTSLLHPRSTPPSPPLSAHSRRAPLVPAPHVAFTSDWPPSGARRLHLSLPTHRMGF